MFLPPIVLYDDNQSLVEILKAIALKELSLAAHATNESKKIQRILKRLEDINELTSSAADMYDINEIKQSSSANAQAIQLLQQVTDSSLHEILQLMNVEELYNLCPLPANYVCKLSAQGQGKVTCKRDAFFGGTSCIEKLNIIAIDGGITGNFKYRAATENLQQEFEAVSNELRIDFLRPYTKAPKISTPNIAVLTGYGVTARHVECSEKVTRGLAWFALTIWDFGRKKTDKYRIVILGNNKAGLNHDSGIVK